MGRKGRGGSAKAKLPSICFYCMREFQDETTLVAHQQARHFRCVECNRKLRTLSAMRHHLDGVHKVQLKRVPNAKEGHDDPNINCVGMDGAPAWFMHQLMAEHGDPAAKEALAAVAGAGAAAAAGVPVGVAVVDPPYGQPAYGGPPHGHAPYGAAPYHPPYGAPAYGAPAYGAPAYGAPSYAPPAYGGPAYGAPPPHMGPGGYPQPPHMRHLPPHPQPAPAAAASAAPTGPSAPGSAAPAAPLTPLTPGRSLGMPAVPSVSNGYGSALAPPPSGMGGLQSPLPVMPAAQHAAGESGAPAHSAAAAPAAAGGAAGAGAGAGAGPATVNTVEVATAAAVAGPSGIRFVFTDEAMSPEEKRAMLPRYAKAGIAVTA
ncbi:hypothetical protein FNF27_07112 [Cafeteria roenbergensis]|uniref:C2H2-type domain-containing protein n=1 Tax=Cafeteria roenbergensis TaxID=33653 RepID=A0A5A8DTI4_CAFRO|nr:hypothetical protein FNF27_07112 [Cafeteria roenbergensis]